MNLFSRTLPNSDETSMSSSPDTLSRFSPAAIMAFSSFMPRSRLISSALYCRL
jgi:hypothetical protein